MSKITHEIIENYQEFLQAKNYPNIGRAMKLSNGVFDVIVTLDVGPRIMHFSLAGKKNMFNDDCSLIEHMRMGRHGIPTVDTGYGMRRRRSPEAMPSMTSLWRSMS